MNFDEPLRRPSQLAALAQWVVREARESDESRCVEWKVGYDLTAVPGRLATARQILAFSNRHPDQAALEAGGCAYLVIGAEPGNPAGVDEHDPANLENWLSPYLGDKVGWSPAYVSVEGSQVLIITVEPPRWGAPIHVLRQTGVDLQGKTVPEGRVWIRKLGKSDVAKAADMDMLVERARAGARTLSLGVEAHPPQVAAISSYALSAQCRDAFLAEQTERLLADVPAADDLLSPLVFIGPGPDEYREQVNSYVAQSKTYWNEVVVTDFVEQAEAALTFKVRNATDQVFDSVQVEALFPFLPGSIYADPDDARESLQPPEAPPPYGERTWADPGSIDLRRRLDQEPTEIEESHDQDDQILVRFKPVLVRPRNTHALTPLYLALPPALAGTEVEVPWRATSSSTPGQIQGTLRLAIAPDPGSETSASKGQTLPGTRPGS